MARFRLLLCQVSVLGSRQKLKTNYRIKPSSEDNSVLRMWAILHWKLTTSRVKIKTYSKNQKIPFGPVEKKTLNVTKMQICEK